MKHIYVILIALFSGFLHAETTDVEDGKLADTLPVVKLSPALKMRPVDRDWAYYRSVACELISKETAHSKVEDRLLAKRKSQCLNKYQSFFSSPIEQ